MSRRAIGAGVLSLVLTTTACTAGSRTEAPASRGPVGGTLRLGMGNVSYWGMDPRDEWSASTWELFRCCLVRTMMSYDVSGDTPDLRPIPDIAAAPPEISTDGLTWTFRLREGLHYAPPLDDVEITSGDFVRSISRAARSFDPEVGGLPGYLRMIEGFDDYVEGKASAIVGLQTPDPYTLRITTTRLDSTLLYMLALPVTAPIPPQPGDPEAPFGVATGYDMTPKPDGGQDAYGRVMVASGPYMYEGASGVDYSLPPDERTPPSGFTPWRVDIQAGFRVKQFGSITLVRNPSWVPEDDPLRMALPDRIELVGGMPKDLFAQMESSEVTMVFDWDPPPRMIEAYQNDPALRPLIQTPVGSIGLIFASFNVARPPFDDVAVRKAVAYAMDRVGLTELFVGPGVRVAQHFALDTFEASLLASWAGLPGDGGHGDPSAAQRAMEDSRHADNGRCADPACNDVPIEVRAAMEPGVDALGDALRHLGITPDFELVDEPYDCLDPEAPQAMCIGMGWLPDFPSGSQYMGELFASDGALPMTRLGATPAELKRWGYDVRQVPSLDERIERCERELGAGQAACWARLDQYVMTQLMPAVPMGYFATLRLSSQEIGPFPWDQVLVNPALERIVPPSDDG
jgi:peptide/nickel transport system substrate-binding protein